MKCLKKHAIKSTGERFGMFDRFPRSKCCDAGQPREERYTRMLQGKVALVTGGSSGIGAAISERFLKEGGRVMIAGRSQEKCQRALDALREVADPQRVGFVCGDVSREADAQHMVAEVVGRFDRIDILVNSAGVYLAKRAEETTETEWDRVVDINLKGVFLCSRAVYPHFKKQGGGVIINISSDAGIIGNPNCAAYCASKGGVSNLTRAMALDYARENIRVNAVCPGVVDTPMFHDEIRRRRDAEVYIQKTHEEHPIGRVAKPEEVAHAVFMLAVGGASFITGANLAVDGGITAK